MTALRRGAAFGAVVFLWPLVRLARQLEGQPMVLVTQLLVASLVSVAVVSWLAPRLRSGPHVALVVVGCGVAPLLITGRWAAVWCVATAALALPAIWRLSVHPALVAPIDLSRVLAPLGVVAAITGRGIDDGLPWIPLAVMAGVVLLALVRPSAAVALDRLAGRAWGGIRRFAAGLGTVVRLAGLWLVAVVVVLVPWLVQRTVRWDPLATRRAGSRWLAHDATERVEPDLRWAREPRALRRPARALHGLATGLVIVALVAALAWGGWTIADRATSSEPGETAGPPATGGVVAIERMNSLPWVGSVGDATDAMFDRVRLSQYVGGELPDVSSRYLNVTGGRRSTWRPPGRRCSMVKVWMFGGSALFGVSQRDDHTVASELARVAASNGVRLDIENWGVPGDVSWQQLRRLERALASEPAPDLVMFYDGFNDGYTIGDMSKVNWVRPGQFIGPLDRIHMPAITDLSQTIAKEGGGRDLTVHIDDSAQSTPGGGGSTSIAQYRNTDDLTRRVLGTYGIPFVHVLQPFLDMRVPHLPGEPLVSPPDVARTRRFVAAAPEGTVDLTGVFNGRREEYFVDGVHVLEEANTIIAAALWRETAEQFRTLAGELAGEGEAGCS